MAHTLTIAQSFFDADSLNYVSVNEEDVSSGYTLKHGDNIMVYVSSMTGVVINGQRYSASLSLDLSDTDITIDVGAAGSLDQSVVITISYTENIVEVTVTSELTILATKDKYCDKDIAVKVNLQDTMVTSNGTYTPDTGKFFKTVTVDVPSIEDVDTAAALTAKLEAANVDRAYRYTGTTGSEYTNGNLYLVIDKSSTEQIPYITFSSDNEFSLATSDNTAPWDGTLEYSTDKNTWSTWGGESITAASNSGSYALYLRGSGNTKITGNSGTKFAITGTDVTCTGNIENLLDYTTVANGAHPTMAPQCYMNMFRDCISLTVAPELKAAEMTAGCYSAMFRGCTSLTATPVMSATAAADGCCNNMFYGCTSLTTASVPPATTLTLMSYRAMFQGCTSLTTAPALPATTLAKSCYENMFYGCTSLTTAPALPVTMSADSCYYSMFQGCTSLTTAPALPATTLVKRCYRAMFQGCTSLTTAPALPATTLAEDCYYSMFQGCTSLTTAPALPATTLAEDCYYSMFQGCTSLTTAPALPATTLAEDCYYSMFQGCTSLKVSETQTSSYQYAWRIPTSGTGTTANYWNSTMLTSTGGTFTTDPVINTTYYLENAPV